MDKTAPGISKKFGERLGKFKKRAHISFVKMSFGTSISANHINNTVKGKTNTTLRQLESYARFFGVRVYELLQFDAPVPDRATLQKNIKIGRATSELQSRENLVCRLLLEKKKKK